MTSALSSGRPWFAGLTLVCALSAGAQTPRRAPAPASPIAALELSEDGQLVIDQRSKLAWARCAEGMQWNGSTCSGQRQLFDRAQALTRAQARAQQDGLRWRLPRAPELRRLVDKQANPPGLPPAFFPAAPGAWHWSGTVTIQNYANNPYNYGNLSQGSASTGSRLATQVGWAVDMDTGEARGDMPRSSKMALRLVRPYTPEAAPGAAHDTESEVANRP